MIVDGSKIAEEVRQSLIVRIPELPPGLKLGVVSIGGDSVSERFISMKRKFGSMVGIETEIFKFDPEILSETLHHELVRLAHDTPGIGGIIVQLPLPLRLDMKSVLDLVPVEKDVDVLSTRAKELFRRGSSSILPPVVAAVKEILERSNIVITPEKKVVIIGKGPLVGRPLADWVRLSGNEPTVVDITTPDIKALLLAADIIISGAGQPHLITPAMIKEGIVLVDAGTSEIENRLAGDADLECAEKCSVFTPVPGGVGPITIAMLFKNFVDLNVKKV